MTDTPRNQTQEGALAAGREEPAVRVVDVTMEFASGVRALEDVSFALPKGELTSIIGPSGCGKTTTLKIIAGLIQPTSGEVFVNSKPVQGPGPDRAMVFQDFALMPWATVLRNAAFGLELRGVDRKSTRLNSQSRQYLVCRLLLEKKNQKSPRLNYILPTIPYPFTCDTTSI